MLPPINPVFYPHSFYDKRGTFYYSVDVKTLKWFDIYMSIRVTKNGTTSAITSMVAYATGVGGSLYSVTKKEAKTCE